MLKKIINRANYKFLRTDRSRMSNIFIDDNDNTFLGFTDYPKIDHTDSEIHITRADERLNLRFDLISDEHYNIPDLWWAIFENNDIMNPYTIKKDEELEIPSREAMLTFLRRGEK